MRAVGRLAEQAVNRALLSDERVTTAAEGKRTLTGNEDTEALAGNIQRVVVLAMPVVRRISRGARLTRAPYVMVASSTVSVGVAVRTGARELQVLGSLVAHKLEQVTGAPADPALVKKVAIDLYLEPKRVPGTERRQAPPRSAHAQVGADRRLRTLDVETRGESARSRRTDRRRRTRETLGDCSAAAGG